MRKNLCLVIVALLLNVAANAQQRSIARGAVEGELYMTIGWYVNYYEIDYKAILHITENGKKVEINHSMKYQPPDAGTGADLPMQAYHIMADATPGAVYISDWYMTYEATEKNRLWFSDDYGKTWELRDKPVYQSFYRAANVKGLIYRSGKNGYYKSEDYGYTFSETDFGIGGTEPGLQNGEAFSLRYTSDRLLLYTHDFGETYMQIPIDSQFLHGSFSDVFRGGLSGEVYITSRFPDNIYKVSFSADTGYNFRVVHQRQSYIDFMSDRKAGDFYIITRQVIETQQPWGYYMRVCIEHYTDYGETLVGTYCHDLTREGVVTGVGDISTGSMSIQVYPNPASGELRVTSYELQARNVEIFDLMGRNVETWHATSPQIGTIEINLAHLPAGMYFIRITTDKGTTTKKIIKK